MCWNARLKRRKRQTMQPRRTRNNRWPFGWLLLLMLVAGHAGAGNPPPFLVDGAQQSNRITIYSEYLADPGHSLHLEDLLSGRFDDQFRPAVRSRERLEAAAEQIFEMQAVAGIDRKSTRLNS